MLCLLHLLHGVLSLLHIVLGIYVAITLLILNHSFPSQYSSILSTCSNHLNTLWSALLPNSLFIPALLHKSSCLTVFIHDTPTKLLKHFISRTFAFFLPEFLIPHAYAPYNAIGTITPSYRHFLAFIPNPQLLITLFSTSQALYPSFILCTTSLSHPLLAALQSQVLKTIHFL